MANKGWVGLTIFGWWFSYLHSLVQRYLTELENNVHMLRVEKRKMWEEQIELQEYCEEVKRLLKEIREKICDPCVVQQQVG